MADNINPLFGLTPKAPSVNISTANTARDGTGTLGTLLTAAKKTMVTKIWYKATGNTTAGMIRLFLTDTDGNNPRMFDELIVSAITVTSNTKGAEGYINYGQFVIESGQVIKCSTHIAESFNVFCSAAELES
jgi:hypothetical protein